MSKNAGIFIATLTVNCNAAADQTEMFWSHHLAVVQECPKAKTGREDRFPSALQVNASGAGASKSRVRLVIVSFYRGKGLIVKAVARKMGNSS